MDDLKKATAQAIVNIFETGSAHGDYGQVTLLQGDTGHLTYGRAQTTLSSGNLFLLINSYINTEDCEFGTELGNYLERLAAKDLSLDEDVLFKRLLRSAGEDPVMKEVQDRFFDDVYWQPAVRSAEYIGAEKPLSSAIIYDSRIHGSWHSIRDRTNNQFGTLLDIGEQQWINHYIATRRDWLANHSNNLLNKTVYRMDSFQKLLEDENWSLSLPITCRGILITNELLEKPFNARADEMEKTRPILRLKSPMENNDSVYELQHALSDRGLEVNTDGIFGPNTKAAVITWQNSAGLVADGIVGPATWSSLGLD